MIYWKTLELIDNWIISLIPLPIWNIYYTEKYIRLSHNDGESICIVFIMNDKLFFTTSQEERSIIDKWGPMEEEN